ncbi:hypothetical protein KKP89_02580 [Methanothermococcus sp. SCGC AD-155-N22]|nr:hypothetical protein [Methanothermococcus sp. SCGC AD-155-N22]
MIRDLIKEAVNSLDACLELRKEVIKRILRGKLSESDIIEIVDPDAAIRASERPIDIECDMEILKTVIEKL